MDKNKIKLLTSREKEVLKLVLKGYQNKAIAKSLFITNHTVKAHLSKIYEKFGVHNKVQVALYIINNKIIDIDNL